MGLLCAEPNVRNLKQMHYQDFLDSWAQNKTSEISKMSFQEFWDSCAQNKTSEISNSELSRIMGLLCAEQNVVNLKSEGYWELMRRVKMRRSTEGYWELRRRVYIYIYIHIYI